MSRFPRLRRRPDHWRDAHERAKARAAERLDGPLGLAESQWLDEHLAGCPACAAVAESYAADRQSLRSLRDQAPEPPRDLWARTAAAIEQLSAETAPAPTHAPSSPARVRGLPLGTMSAVAVVVIVVGASLLSRGIAGPGVGPVASPATSGGIAAVSTSPGPALPGAEATPFAVNPGGVSYLDRGPGGLVISTVDVEEVCPEGGSSNCSATPNQASQDVPIDSAVRTLIGSPKSKQAVAISKTATAGDQVVIVQLPDRQATATPGPTPTRTAAPTASPSDTATAAPTTTDEPAVSPTPTVVVSSAPSETPIGTPQATSTDLAIASDIQVVGESAAFSADGTWFAFTARSKADAGPDVYVWRVGDHKARQLTKDGISYFASWSGDRAVVSRPADPAARTSDPLSVLVDPSTGAEQAVGALWRPMVDPSGSFAVGWDGTLERVDDPLGWAPANGRLLLRSWSGVGDGGTPSGSDDHRTLADHAAGDFDVRWDETGAWVAIWVGNDGDATVGRLSLYHLDATKGRLEHVKGAPEDVQALSGFSNGGGRLAWATPRGSNGEGTRVQIAAWKVDEVGIVASSPGEDVVVIR